MAALAGRTGRKEGRRRQSQASRASVTAAAGMDGNGMAWHGMAMTEAWPGMAWYGKLVAWLPGAIASASPHIGISRLMWAAGSDQPCTTSRRAIRERGGSSHDGGLHDSHGQPGRLRQRRRKAPTMTRTRATGPALGPRGTRRGRRDRRDRRSRRRMLGLQEDPRGTKRTLGSQAGGARPQHQLTDRLGGTDVSRTSSPSSPATPASASQPRETRNASQTPKPGEAETSRPRCGRLTANDAAAPKATRRCAGVRWTRMPLAVVVRELSDRSGGGGAGLQLTAAAHNSRGAAADETRRDGGAD